jgi:ribulose-phosphate 3-epimerase
MLLNKKIQFYVSTISDDPKFIFDRLQLYKEFGISGIHFDVMDGIFVPRLGLYPELLESMKNSTDLPIEVHLMLSNPDKYIKTFIDAGAARILVHFETLENPNTTLDFINKLGAENCVVLNPNTDYFVLKAYLNKIDNVMLMAINPGVPKHPLIPETFTKLKNLRNWLDKIKPDIKIGIDGGVTFENILHLEASGADWLICGSGTIFKSGANLIENLSNLSDVIDSM